MADDRDPAAHWAMGRALWLRGRHDQSVVELERAIDLSPNFALGHYTLAFVHSQTGDPKAAIASSDHSRRLSPFDPLLFGMLGARAMALVRLGRFEEAADWAVKAAARPNAHPHILAIAAFSLALCGLARRGARSGPPRCAARIPATASPTSSVPSGSTRTARRCSAKAPSASGWRDERGGIEGGHPPLSAEGARARACDRPGGQFRQGRLRDQSAVRSSCPSRDPYPVPDWVR